MKFIKLIGIMLLISNTVSCKTPNTSFFIPVQEQKYVSNVFNYTCRNNLCDVYLSSTIEGQSEYLELYSLIEQAHEGDIINIHLAGYGGQIDTVFRVANAIDNSKAEINTVVEGPVYSAHALLAMLGKHITITRYGFFMFHWAAIYDTVIKEYVFPSEICKYEIGIKDRGQDSYKKCLEDQAAVEYTFKQLCIKYVYPYLSSKEISQLEKGQNITILAPDMFKRMSRSLTPVH